MCRKRSWKILQKIKSAMTILCIPTLKSAKNTEKTIIFADRRFQCEYIKEKLLKKNVKADAVFSKIDSSPNSVRERNRKDSDHNKETIDKFKRNELDVLINVKMLTEGTDIPDVKSIFLTRNTTSKILFTQMVGRALRGKRAGGGEAKDIANIVIFSDKWKHLIHWAQHDLSGGLDQSALSRAAYPMQYISIRLIQELSRQMEEVSGFQERPYIETIPVGWYKAEYSVVVNNEIGDTITANHCVLVYSQTEAKFKDFIKDFIKAQTKKDTRLLDWQKESPSSEWVEEGSLEFVQKYFDAKEDNFGGTLKDDLIHLARHIGQNDAEPDFISFEERSKYDLDKIAGEFMNVLPIEQYKSLRLLFEKEASLWKEWYKNFNSFKSAFDHSINRALAVQNGDLERETRLTKTAHQERESSEARELTEEEKQEVKERDGHQCLCCGADRKLQVDHVRSYKYTNSTTLGNSQTLCRYCNRIKGTQHINFRINRSELSAPIAFQPIEAGRDDEEFQKKDYLEICLRRTINFFYRCQAVCSIDLHLRTGGKYYKKWVIHLYSANNTEWLKKYNKELLDYVKKTLGQKQVKKIEISQPL